MAKIKADDVAGSIGEQAAEKPLYTLKDNNLFVEGHGLIKKEPGTLTPLTQKEFDALVTFGGMNDYTEAMIIKKYLKRVFENEEEEAVTVITKKTYSLTE